MSNRWMWLTGAAACAACCAPLLVPLLTAAGLGGLGAVGAGGLFGLSRAELLCLGLLAAAIAGAVYLWRRSAKTAAGSPATPSCKVGGACDPSSANT